LKDLAEARIFFALWPDATTARAIAAAARELCADGKPVARERLHLTLAFHGRIDAAATAELRRRARAVHLPAFNLQLERVGYFARPRILWLGPTHVPVPLQQLAALLAPTDRAAGSASHFQPHVSLARHAAPPAAGRFVAPIAWPVREFMLVESGAAGVAGAYACRGRWPLGQACPSMK